MFRSHTMALALALAGVLLAPSGRLAAQEPKYTPALPAFEFHSGFWVNLHHQLYLEGRLRQARADTDADASAGRTLDSYIPPMPLQSLSASEQQAWTAAVAAYAADWSQRDLRNNDMVLINDRLTELEDCRELLLEKGEPAQCISGLRPEMIAALNSAAPIYRARYWPQQDRQNRAWIAGVAPQVRGMGEVVGDALIAIYGRRWPPGPLRVDVVGYAGSGGAYTELIPIEHIVLSSVDSRNQGAPAFEVLFREASQPLAQSVGQAIAEECRRQSKPIPREFLQALLSYTTGQLVQGAFALEYAGTPGSAYIPYADRNGLFTGPWSGYQDILTRYWQPYLQGRLSLNNAVARMVSSW